MKPQPTEIDGEMYYPIYDNHSSRDCMSCAVTPDGSACGYKSAAHEKLLCHRGVDTPTGPYGCVALKFTWQTGLRAAVFHANRTRVKNEPDNV